MVKKQTDRVVRARRWVMAGAVATAVAGTAGSGQAADMSGDRSADWNSAQDAFLMASAEGEGEASAEGGEGEAASEGGEGEGEGEGEGAAAVDPEIQLLTDLSFMQGHAYAGLKLYEMGETELGVEHIGHPITEKYDAVAGAVERMGYSDLKGQLETMSEAAEAGKSADELASLYDEVAATLESIRDETGGGAASQLKALALLTRIAADEYQIAFKDGEMVNAQEYQDAWGFMQIVKQEARELAESDDAQVAEAAEAILGHAEAAEGVFAGVTGDGIAEPDASSIYGAAARMEIAANRLS